MLLHIVGRKFVPVVCLLVFNILIKSLKLHCNRCPRSKRVTKGHKAMVTLCEWAKMNSVWSHNQLVCAGLF